MTLVTVAISTYNSSEFIIETLESIHAQSYSNIELIVSDDASTDNSLELVKEWVGIPKNRERFSKIQILEVSENTGPSANANRKLKVATGEWIKFLGSDDTMMPDCIEKNIQYIAENPETRVLFSRINIYKDTFEADNFLLTTPGEITRNSILWPRRTSESQYKLLLVGDRIHFSPSLFIHRETLLSVGGFDERYKLMEDYPLWLNLTRKSYRLNFMDKITVNYRRHAKAINNTGIRYIVNPNYFRQEKFRKRYTYPNLPFEIKHYQRFTWHSSQIFRIRFFNRPFIINRFLHTLFTAYLNPFKYLIWIKKHLKINTVDNEFYM